MEFQDKSLRCVDCGDEFIWTAGEQLFFADKQFKNEPKRCKMCKAKRANRAAAGPSMRERVETQTTCSACGKDTTVPLSICIADSPLLANGHPPAPSCFHTKERRPGRRMARYGNRKGWAPQKPIN